MGHSSAPLPVCGPRVYSLAESSEDESLGMASPAKRGSKVTPKREQWHRESRLVRVVALASVLLAIVCAVMMVSMATAKGPVEGHQGSLIDLAEVGETSQVVDQRRGWYRSYLESTVNKGQALDSDKLGTVPQGSLVYVAEMHGSRARILKPIPGWMSSWTEGVEVLVRDRSIGKTSQEMQDAEQDRLANVMRMTEIQEKLVQAMNKMKGEGAAAQQLHHKSQQVLHQAPKASERLVKQVANGLGETPGAGAMKLLGHVGESREFHGLRGMVEQQAGKLREQAPVDAERTAGVEALMMEMSSEDAADDQAAAHRMWQPLAF